jgi:hypothetical protein
MARKYLWLAAGLLFAVAALGRAADPAPVLHEDLSAMPSAGPVTAAEAAPAVVEGPPAVAAPCCHCCQARAHGDCLHRLCDWLTYCPPKTPCHCGLHGWCSSCGCGGNGGCGGHKCTPCCLPVYMYFLDRCDCRLGFPPVCCPPDCPPANAGPGPAAVPQTAERPSTVEPLPAPVPLDGAATPQATPGS